MVSSSTFSHNSATMGGYGYGYGGGIDNFGKLTVSSSTFSHNTSKARGGLNIGGGGIFNGGKLTVSSSTFNGNSASNFGGGILNSGGTVKVNNSTLSGNLASSGGGISNGDPSGPGGTVTVSSSTLSGNLGGGMYNAASYSVTLTGTIVANSPSGSNCHGKITDGGYNLDSGFTCGFTNHALNNTNPKLGPLRNNGGPTPTMALLQGSKAIDWVALSDCPSTDQRGSQRPDDSESSCDIGAYESAY
jgi:hypothetical protein